MPISLALTLALAIIGGTAFIVRLEGKVGTLDNKFKEIRMGQKGSKSEKGDPGSMGEKGQEGSRGEKGIPVPLGEKGPQVFPGNLA